MVSKLDLAVSGQAIGYNPVVSIKNDSNQYSQLLDAWATLAYQRKKGIILPTEERRKLETRYLTTEYDTREQRITSFMQLKYDLGDAPLEEVRVLVERRLDSLVNASNLKDRWEKKALLNQERIDRLVAYLDNRVFETGKPLQEAYVAERYKPPLH